MNVAVPPASVVVSPEVGLTVVPATEAGRQFADEIGALKEPRLAEQLRTVVRQLIDYAIMLGGG